MGTRFLIWDEGGEHMGIQATSKAIRLIAELEVRVSKLEAELEALKASKSKTRRITKEKK